MESRHKTKSLLARPFVATRLAAAGLAAAWRHEEAFRLEVIAFAVLVPVSFLYGKTAVERALLVGSLLLVLIVELVNSALEATLDRISLEEHALIKRAKDVSSAAVGMTLVNAAAIWLLILLGD
ncbi:MAG: diacylglycerol kinase [Betaproteobacteria bacterium]|nr:MAG: diacylglycerol kinase [Betaproteobacteria bacterium]